MAAGREPEAWLAGVAGDGLPESLEVPAVAAKADIIAAWLWRSLQSSDNSNRRGAREAAGAGGRRSARGQRGAGGRRGAGAGGGRRLVYALPQGAVVEPVAAAVRGWLARLGLTDQVGLHLSMGLWAATEGPAWREDMHRPAIVIGTTEYLVSKALVRAFGVGSTLWPIDFALVTNGAQWIVHDERLSRQAAATLRSIAAAAERWGTAEPFGVTVLSSAGERVREVPRLRGVERAALAAGPAELLMVAPAPAARTLARRSRPPSAWRSFWRCSTPRAGWAMRRARSCREGEGNETDPDIGVAWATWTPGEDGEPDPEVRFPAAEWRCAVPLRLVGEFARTVPSGGETPRGRGCGSVTEPRSGRSRCCWSTPRTGATTRSVALTRRRGRWFRGARSCERRREEAALEAELAALALLTGVAARQGRRRRLRQLRRWEAAEAAEAEAAEAEADEEAERRPWQTLNSHSEETRDQAAALVRVLGATIPAAAAASAVLGAYLHDVGKGHSTWQDALCALAPEPDATAVQAGRPGPSPGMARAGGWSSPAGCGSCTS